MDAFQVTPAELLGPLNPVEQQNAPKLLYIAGNAEVLKRGRVAIVGSREASAEGIQRAQKLSKLLCQRGVTIVSGLAKGIDTAAHMAATHYGNTIAVIGTPLNVAYPKSNAGLQELLMRDHLVVSQFAPGTATQKHHFPMRNRTMALIADASVIIEASNTSGSLSQGWEALRLGRRLFIAQSVVNNPDLTWPKEMIEYGAEILSDASFESLVDDLPARAETEIADAAPF